MTLVEKIKTIYAQLKDEDFISTIVVQDTGSGDFIAEWNHPTLTQPTQQELDAITGDYVEPDPDVDALYDMVIASADKQESEINALRKIIKAVVMALNEGAFVPGSNYTPAQIKTYIKNRM